MLHIARRSHSRCEASAFYLETAAEGRLYPPHRERGEGVHFVIARIEGAQEAQRMTTFMESSVQCLIGR
jgi:hypothetical protein